MSAVASERSSELPLRHPMRHLQSVSPRGSSQDEPAFVIALFDVEGRLLRGSDSFSALLENRALKDDLLALPRSLSLRRACGYAPATTCQPTARTICVGGRDFILRGHFVESHADPDITVALTLSAAPVEGRSRVSAPPVQRSRRVRRPWQPSIHAPLPLRRPRIPLEPGR